MLELLFEMLLQFVVELLVEGAFELGVRGLVDVFLNVRPLNIAVSLIGYAVLGAIGGAISVWLLPMHALTSPLAQYTNLALTPIALGFVFQWLGLRREARNKQRMLLDRFSYGFVFALSMGLVRFYFAA